MVILRVLYNSLSGFFKQHSDERTAEWFLMSSYLPTLIVSLTYIVAIKFVLPKVLKLSQPLNVNKYAFVYDVLVLLVNGYIVAKTKESDWFSGYNTRCHTHKLGGFETHGWMTEVCWVYFISKFLNLFSSTFLALQKRDPGTKLNYDVFTLMSVWFIVRYFPEWPIAWFMTVDTVGQMLSSSTCIVSSLLGVMFNFNHNATRYFLLIVQTLQNLVLFFHLPNVLTVNTCDFPLVYCWWALLQFLAFTKLTISSFRTNRRKRELKQRLSECSKFYDENPTMVRLSFSGASSFPTDSSVTKRNINTLKVQV